LSAFSYLFPALQTKLSPVIVAAQGGHNEVLNTLLDAKADINAQGLVSVALVERFLAWLVAGAHNFMHFRSSTHNRDWRRR
jgi:hypothetical protein